MKLKILNLYACVGGNRSRWNDEDIDEVKMLKCKICGKKLSSEDYLGDYYGKCEGECDLG